MDIQILLEVLRPSRVMGKYHGVILVLVLVRMVVMLGVSGGGVKASG